MVGLNFFFFYVSSLSVSKQYFMVPTNTQDRYGSDNGQHFILSDRYYRQLLHVAVSVSLVGIVVAICLGQIKTPASSFVKDYGKILLRHHNLKGNQKMCVSSDC